MNPDELLPPGRVLVIDDEEPVVETIARMLETEGYIVDSATSGEQGIELVRKIKHDVILTDLRLGDMLGTDVLREVKAIHQKCAVIILTGYATTESAVEAIKLGASDYLTKPIRMSELLMAVRNQMAAVQLNSRIYELNHAVEEERDKLRRSIAELGLLKRLASGMMSALSYIEGWEIILDFLVGEVKADVAVIFDVERGTVKLGNNSFPGPREREQICEQIVKATNRKDLDNSTIFNFLQGADKEKFDVNKGELKSFVVVPLNLEGRLIALIVAASRTDEQFSELWGGFSNQIAREASEFLTRVKRSVEAQQHWTSAIVENTLDGLVVANIAKSQYLLNPVARRLIEVPLGMEPTRKIIESRLGLNFDKILEELRAEIGQNPAQKTLLKHSDLIWRGNNVFLRLNISFLPGSHVGDGDELLIVMHDVTQEKSVEEMKGKLMANISHELRTPTSVLKEFISLILDGVAGDLSSSQRQYIQIMQSNVERLSRLIENLLTLARSDSGGFSIILRSLSIAPVVENVVLSLTPKLVHKGMTITVNMPPELPPVYADKDAVTQILTNLIENARKYSPENTDVTITAQIKGGRVEIAVTDEGYGIPTSEYEAIFKRFHRLVDKDDPKFQEGVGLGLPLVKDLVTRHGGDIWLKSEVGKGSTFYFSLQVAEVSEEETFERA